MISIRWIFITATMLLPPARSVEVVVTVPKSTPADAKVFISGSSAEAGTWKADGLPMTRGKDGRHHADIHLAQGQTLEFKFTLGSWETVEKNASGQDVGNRKLTSESPARYECKVEQWAAASKPVSKSTLSGDIRYHQKFASAHLHNERTLVVYLPPDYKSNSNQRFPVLYMHDGQNIFDAATSFIGAEWQADEIAEKLIKSGRIRPIIIVGIYNNADRMREYTPTWTEKRDVGAGDGKRSGLGADYARFLIEEVKPFIDHTYRTNPGRADTAVVGSSMGGLISLYLASQHPDIFSMCGVISPALMIDDRRLILELEKNPDPLKRIRIWLDMGTKEGRQIAGFSTALNDTRRLAKLFGATGLKKDRDYRYLEVKDGEHNERAWAARFDQVLIFFFGR